ncbi:MAG: hypothetical protein APF80_01355 [Alphaproteobacteria bacterium BRH_c36]|nr:MAG: hypothetical protein APF80_01355 [Alphaproteobacteria bacterium BRH_c36]
MARMPFMTWLVVSAAWIAAIGWMAWTSWPHLPLDISHTDPATRAAFDQAVLMHAGRHAALALLPPLLVLAVMRFVSR